MLCLLCGLASFGYKPVKGLEADKKVISYTECDDTVQMISRQTLLRHNASSRRCRRWRH